MGEATTQKSPGVVVAQPARIALVKIIAAKLIDFIIDLLSVLGCFEIIAVAACLMFTGGIRPALAVAQQGNKTCRAAKAPCQPSSRQTATTAISAAMSQAHQGTSEMSQSIIALPS
jgi:hypothetical protein